MKSCMLSYLDIKPTKKTKIMYTITLMYNSKLSVHMYKLTTTESQEQIDEQNTKFNSSSQCVCTIKYNCVHLYSKYGGVHMYIVLTLCEFMKSHSLSYLDRKPSKSKKCAHNHFDV